MTLSVKVTIPELGISNAILSAGQEVGGYRSIALADGSVSVRYRIGDEDPAAGDAKANEAPNLGAHTIDIIDLDTGAVVQSYERPCAQARTHFRYPPVSSKIKRSAKWLVDNRHVFPYGMKDIETKGRPVLTYDGPNSFSGMERRWATTGERVDIGLTTEDAADFIAGLTGPDNVMIQGECAQAAPLFFEDKRTGKPIDLRVYPRANDYSYGSSYHGSPWMPATDASDNGVNIAESFNHAPNLSFIPAMLTDDPWHLWNLQHWANATLLDNGAVTPEGPAISLTTEARDLAWCLRLIGMAYIATKWFEDNGSLPANCLDSGYWLQATKNTMKYTLQPIMDAPDFQVFRCFTSLANSSFAPWQQSYLMDVLAEMVLAGLGFFQPAYLWGMGCAVAQASGKVGWPACGPCVYWIYIGPPGARLASWAEAYQFASATSGPGAGGMFTPEWTAAIAKDQFNGGQFLPGMNNEYPMMAHGNLAGALYIEQLGIMKITETYPDLGQAYANIHRMFVAMEAQHKAPNGADEWNRGWFFDGRHAITFDASAIPNVVIQPTPSAPPPAPNPPPVITPAPEPAPQPQPQPETKMSITDDVKAEIATIKNDVATLIAAAHARIAAVIAAAAGNSINPADLQGPLDDLKALHEQLSSEASALPSATS